MVTSATDHCTWMLKSGVSSGSSLQSSQEVAPRTLRGRFHLASGLYPIRPAQPQREALPLAHSARFRQDAETAPIRLRRLARRRLKPLHHRPQDFLPLRTQPVGRNSIPATIVELRELGHNSSLASHTPARSHSFRLALKTFSLFSVEARGPFTGPPASATRFVCRPASVSCQSANSPDA